MRLLVTGGAGYVGSVCAARLVESGHEVTVVDDLSTGHADAVPTGARFVQGDIGEVAGTLLADGFDGVLHFAAKSLVGESMTDPAKYWQGNVVTSLKLLDAIKEHGTPAWSSPPPPPPTASRRRSRSRRPPRPARPTPTARASWPSTTR